MVNCKNLLVVSYIYPSRLTYRVPLPTREFGNLDEQPLARDVFEAGLDDAQLHSTLNRVG